MFLVSLISEQTIPNLLPVLHLKPEASLLVHTKHEENSKKPAERIKALLPEDMEIILQQVDAYQIDQIQAVLFDVLKEIPDIVFNLTGGTKPMALAAFQVARTLKARCIYYRTEGVRDRSQQSVLYWYAFDEQGHFVFTKKHSVPSLLTIDLYLKAYIGDYEEAKPDPTQHGYDMENAIYLTMENFVQDGKIDEVKRNIKPKEIKDQAEIDLLIRRGNNVAVLEIKSGGSGSGKKAIDQLTTVVAREYLGTYAKRVIVTRPDPDAQTAWYKALASKLRVEVIEIRDPLERSRLSKRDQSTLLQRIDQILPPTKAE